MGLLNILTGIASILNPKNLSYQSKSLFPKEFDYYWDIKSKEWDKFSRNFKALPYDDKSLLTTVLSERLERLDSPYQDWRTSDHDIYYKTYLEASQEVARAWYYRGGGTADTVSDDAVENFVHHLITARSLLNDCMDHPDTDGLACEKYITVQLGISDDLAKIYKTLKKMRHIDQNLRNPPNLQGHVNYFNATCEKWLGSHDEMFAFAREYAMKDTGYGYMASLICHAHLQMWLYLIAFDEDEAAAGAYFTQQTVKDELLAAHNWFLSNVNDDTSGFNIMAHNMFTGLLYWSEEHEAAQYHFRAMKKRATPFPWMYIGTTDLNKARKLYQE